MSGSYGNMAESIFAIHRALDGEKEREFQEREQFIGLRIGAEDFLLSIAGVREINMLTPITFVPNASEFIDGVINLRGNILPALNLRKMMGVPRGEPTPSCRIVIARQDDMSFGLLVDGITQVVSLLPTEIERQSLPGRGTGATDLIGSVSKQDGKICGIIDLASVLKAALAASAALAGTDDDGTYEEAADESA